LIFFVHGFGGKNTSTWMNFPSLMLDDPRHSDDDLLFYGYASRDQAARASAGSLYESCDGLFNRMQSYETADGVLSRDGHAAYSRIVFVAHSLGGPVVRHMLMTACKNNAAWLDKVAVVFFAPATPGARSRRLIAAFVDGSESGILGMMWTIIRLNWPAVDDLAIDSDFLKEVREGTENLVTTARRNNVQATLTCFGTREKVIYLGKLPAFDEPYSWLTDLNHVTVCKPHFADEPCYDRFANAMASL